MDNAVKIRKDFGRIQNWISGQYQSSSANQYADIYSPYTGEVIGECPMGTTGDVDQAVAAASKAFPGWKNTNIKNRVQVMFRFKDLIEKNLAELSNLVALENGKTLAEAEAGIMKGIECLEYACALPNKIAGEFQEVSAGVTCQMKREPLGVVASISPFNFPFMVPMWTVPLALTAGNAMLLKPSEQVPLSALRMGELLKEAGLPDGIFNVVNGAVEVVEGICDHPDIEAISFVGSSTVAKIVYTRGTATGKQVLALGGAKNHLVCMPDANLEYAPEQIVNSAIGCAGQRCMAASLMVAVGDCSEVIEQMVNYASSVKVGTGQGAIISSAAVKRINSYIDQAEEMGAKVSVDGRNAKPEHYIEGSENGYWVGPTILDNVTPDMPAAHDEIFGPVLSIVHVDTLEEAVELENKSPYGNAASIFTCSGAPAEYLAEHASAGMIGVNIGVPVPREPFSFGGWNDSRYGTGDLTGEDGIYFWTKNKKVTTKWVNPNNPDWMS
ncbi:MAG: CoA-acylating methylmalonate-semialdehyde dehydrogenase [SAR324 cluster bacterium]|nr:CoA-acylating methylmalonate-semialdehyde dehydrogenase [SAR324 cluster bacterium]